MAKTKANEPLDKEEEELMETLLLSEETDDETDEEKPIIVNYNDSDMNKFLNNKESKDLLKFYGFKLPSYYKDKSLKELQKVCEESLKILTNYKESLKGNAKYNHDTVSGLVLAFPKAGEKAKQKTKDTISEHNIMHIFVKNMNELRTFKEKTGTGILHFNNPLQLINRLELLAGSLLAGNSGVIQEFSQIAHLLHQLKVITKKQLNDLLKKYILNK